MGDAQDMRGGEEDLFGEEDFEGSDEAWRTTSPIRRTGAGKHFVAG